MSSELWAFVATSQKGSSPWLFSESMTGHTAPEWKDFIPEKGNNKTRPKRDFKAGRGQVPLQEKVGTRRIGLSWGLIRQNERGTLSWGRKGL